MQLPNGYLELLGQPHSSGKVVSMLRAFGIVRQPRVPDNVLGDGTIVETVEPQDWLVNRAEGVEFGFEDEAAFLGAPPIEWGAGTMLLTQIYLYADQPEQSRYKGVWPFDLSPDDQRPAVRRRLGETGARRRSRDRDTWVFQDYLLTASYGSDDQLAYLVILAKPKHPPPDPDLSARCPDIRTIERLLGRPVDDPALKKALAPIGFDLSGPMPLQTGESDLDSREDFGAFSEFSTPEGENTPVLTRFQMLGDRRYGSAVWPGELPGGLSFDSGWDGILSRAGRDPDDIAESDFAILAHWRSGDRVSEVEYSTMENCVISVSLLLSKN